MRTHLTFALLAAVAFSCSLHATPSQAQRVFVSATGSDGNPCTFASPCRGFQHAHDVTSANGEIDVLDPAGYGPLTITHGISIQAHGFSGISVPNGGTGITINASNADVHLNGLLIDGGGVGSIGIRFNFGGKLTVENCIVRNFTDDGLGYFASAGNTQTLAVSNSYFNDNNNNGISIETFSGSGGVNASIDHTVLSGNNNAGLFVDGEFGTAFLIVAVTDSVAANSSFGIGFEVRSTSGASPTNLSLTHSLAEGNAIGVEAFGVNATLWLAQSTVMGNNTSFNATMGGVIDSFLDNYFAANNSFAGMLTTAGKQ